MAYGKYKGKPISAVPLDYLTWCYNNFEDGKRRTLIQIEIERRQRICPEHLRADRRDKTHEYEILTGSKQGRAGKQAERIAYPHQMSRPALSKRERKKQQRQRYHPKRDRITQEFREIFAEPITPENARITQGAYAGKYIYELPETYVIFMATNHCDTDTGKQCADYLSRRRIKVVIPEIRKPENWLPAPNVSNAAAAMDLAEQQKRANVAMAAKTIRQPVEPIQADECPY
jgi:hypothetical protein